MAHLDVVQQDLAEEEAAVMSFWTDHAMAQAIPLDIPECARMPEPMAWQQQGPPSVMESVAPDDEFPDCRQHQCDEDDPQRLSHMAANGFVTTLVPISNFTVFPWQTVGKIYMVFGGQNYVGSAWALSGTESAIFTAGHCVYDQGSSQWASKVMFKGRYNNGNQVGTWYMKTLYSLKGWINKSGYQYDLGVGLAASEIRPTMGALGWMANFPPNQGPYTGIGYPAKVIPGYNFNGQNMWQSVGSYINGSSIIQMYNNMTGGCSGGPWSVSYNGAPHANGLNSHRYTSQPSTMYSPYFGNGFLNLFNAVKGQ